MKIETLGGMTAPTWVRKMKIETTEDLISVFEKRRVELGISERELALNSGKSHGMYWWWKKKAKTTSFATVLSWCKALNLKISIE